MQTNHGSVAPRRRHGSLVVMGVVAMLILGALTFAAARSLGDFFGHSRGSGSGDTTPPVPAAPVAAVSLTPAAAAAPRASDLSALQRQVLELERSLTAALSAGDTARAEAVRRDLAAARTTRDAAMHGDAGE